MVCYPVCLTCITEVEYLTMTLVSCSTTVKSKYLDRSLKGFLRLLASCYFRGVWEGNSTRSCYNDTVFVRSDYGGGKVKPHDKILSRFCVWDADRFVSELFWCSASLPRKIVAVLWVFFFFFGPFWFSRECRNIKHSFLLVPPISGLLLGGCHKKNTGNAPFLLTRGRKKKTKAT